MCTLFGIKSPVYVVSFTILFAKDQHLFVVCVSGFVNTELVGVFSFASPKEKKAIHRHKTVIEDLCIALHRLDAMGFAFLCHTNLSVRHAAIQLTTAIQAGMEQLIAYYFADKTPDRQQEQTAFPSSVGQLFSMYSDEIIQRALKKFRDHQVLCVSFSLSGGFVLYP